MIIDLTKIKRIHFVGIKGIAMAALAVYCKECGYKVGGSDVVEKFPSDEVLAKAKIKPLVGFSADHIKQMTGSDPVMVVYTGAHGGRDNPEVKEAEKLGIPVLVHGKALGLFMEGKRQISVAGSHGKTTTTAMIATILKTAGFDPSYAIGCGEVRGLGQPGHFGRGNWFVAEADEYATDPHYDKTPRFLWQSPELLVVTNIDFDHPDVYATLSEVTAAFIKFRKKVNSRGEVIVSDSRSCKPLAASSVVGVTNVHFGESRTYFTTVENGVRIGEFMINVPGVHNAGNAALAAIVCHDAGVSWDVIGKGLFAYGGAKRRFEKIGETNGIIFYDDYAHHPKEIEATIRGARQWFPKRRIVAVFQPHTYSRTHALLGDFAKALAKSDEIIITDIYSSAREHETMGVSGELLVQETLGHKSSVHFAQNAQRVLETLEHIGKPGDVVIFMGAGDIYTWGREIYEQLLSKN